MATLYDADGNEVEAFTPEEVKAKEDALKAEFDAKNKEKEGDADKDKNFNALKESLTKKDEEILGVKTELENTKKTIEEQAAQRFIDTQNEVFTGLVGADADLRKKIEDEMNNFKDQPKNKQEFETMAKKALSIVDPMRVVVDPFNGFRNSGKGTDGAGAGSEKAKEFTAEDKAFASKMGITEDDIKNFNK